MKAKNWIPLEERRPPYATEYLVYGRVGVGSYPMSVLVGYYCESGRWRLPGTNQQLALVTHWRALPAGPKEEADDADTTIDAADED